MSNSPQRLAANRANAQLSTGPVSAAGKATVARNAITHGLMSNKLLLEDEDPAAFRDVFDGLCRSLAPVGALEISLVERAAVTLWRQRRLVKAETASLALARHSRQIAKSVSWELGKTLTSSAAHDDLAPFDAEEEQWCRDVIAEIEALEEIDLRTLAQRAPLCHAQLLTDCEGDDPTDFAATHKGGLTAYVSELLQWCRSKLEDAAARPHVLEVADQVRLKHLVLPADTLELLARYQTTLDNQLFKILKALREAQVWRLRTLEGDVSHEGRDDDGIACHAA